MKTRIQETPAVAPSTGSGLWRGKGGRRQKKGKGGKNGKKLRRQNTEDSRP